MKLKIHDKVIFKWLGSIRLGSIYQIKTNSYSVKSDEIIYPNLGIDINYNRFGKILSEETKKYKKGELNLNMEEMNKSKIDIKLDELKEIFDDIKSLHNTSNQVELRKKVVKMKQLLSDYRKLSLTKKSK